MSARHKGVGLIEVLVSLIIISIGLLGAVGLHTRAQQAEMESYQRAQALILLKDMVQRLNANRSAAPCYAFTTDAASGTPYLGAGNTASITCAGAGTSVTRAMADADLAEWDRLLKGGAERLGGNDVGAMIGARGCVRYDVASDLYIVSVAWQGLIATQAPTATCASGLYGSDAQRRIITETVRLAKLD